MPLSLNPPFLRRFFCHCPLLTPFLEVFTDVYKRQPIQDVLNGLVWDGTPRIRSCLHHFLGADESDYVEEMLKHFLLGAIRRVFSPGCKYEEMLCLVGGQGAGKSSLSLIHI